MNLRTTGRVQARRLPSVWEATYQQRPRLNFDELRPGLYLLKQRCTKKGVDHYAILDIGNRLQYDWNHCRRPVIVHQTPPTLRADWAEETGDWDIMGHVTDESGARARIVMATATPNYDLFGNNCEHFARFVATGVRESHQVRGFCLIGALLAVAIIAN